MAAQCVGFSLLLLSCLLAVASPAPLTPVTSPEDADEALSKTLNLVQPDHLEVRPRTPLSGDIEDRTPLVDDAPKSYVEASEFRKSAPPSFADAVKPKPSFFLKKTIPALYKTSKDNQETKKDVLVPSDKLEPPVDERTFDAEIDDKVVAILSAMREIVDTELSTTSPDKNEESTTTTSMGTNGDSTTTTMTSSGTNEEPTTTTMTLSGTNEESTTTTMTSSGTNEEGELPRLSPPIWLHSSMAEAMSDPLRLPMIEPYDRYDRYSHSIARDSLW